MVGWNWLEGKEKGGMEEGRKGEMNGWMEGGWTDREGPLLRPHEVTRGKMMF